MKIQPKLNATTRGWVFIVAACVGAVGPSITWREASPALDYASAAADIVYIYDALGRLVGVVDPAGDTGVYQYDAVGNLTGIARYSSSTVSIIDVSSGSGPAGTSVTISGTGFSPTPGQNTVTFNGTAATVTASTATQLVTTVPAGAATGTIAVTAPGGSATSPTAFTVTSSSGAPTITSFTPTIGTPGTAVTVTGTNFETTASRNRLNFYLARAAVGTASATTLGATVPTGATSGRISVAHPSGAVQSTADFFVPPPDFTVAHVASTGRIVMGGSDISALVNASTKIGLVVFDGAASQPVSLAVLQVNNYAAGVTVMRPDGATVLYQPVGPGNPAQDLHIASLPVTGTYTILLTTGGPDTFTLALSQDLVPVPIAINATVAFSVTRRAQRTPLTFSGTAGQRLTVAITSATVGARLTVIKPDGTALTTGADLQSPTGAVDLPVLPSTGTYTVFIDPHNAGTGSMNVTLSEDVAATLTIGGAAVPVSITQPGQRARATFTGTAGQLINVGLTGSTIANGAWASILKPDGTGLASASFGTTDAAVDGYLPVTGSYTS